MISWLLFSMGMLAVVLWCIIGGVALMFIVKDWDTLRMFVIKKLRKLRVMMRKVIE